MPASCNPGPCRRPSRVVLSSQASGEVEEYAGQEGQALGGPADMSVSAVISTPIEPVPLSALQTPMTVSRDT